MRRCRAVSSFHDCPWLIHRLMYRRTNHKNLHVRGYTEEGTTTTLDTVVLNDQDRFHLAEVVIDRFATGAVANERGGLPPQMPFTMQTEEGSTRPRNTMVRVEASMNASRAIPSPAATAWQLEFARLIAFPASSAVFLDQQWWRDLVSEQPADFVSTRKKDSRDDRGTFQGVLLALTIDVHRVIWEVRSPAVVDRSGHFPTLGQFQEKLGWFVELLGPWLLGSCPPLYRLALSAKLLQPASTAEEAYRVLKTHLPGVNILDSNPNDLLLQINRRKKTSDVVAGLPINRVCTWSKMNVAVFVEPGKPFTWPDNCYSALELDINTAPEKTDILPRESLPLLFKELASLGAEIAENGDKP